MDLARREELRATFDEAACLYYHRARSRYPAALFDGVFEITGLRPPARLLEIGPGTGIATQVFAEQGYRIVGVEPGEEMAKQARNNLEGFGSVEIVTGPLRVLRADHNLRRGSRVLGVPLDRPATRYQQAASLLRDAGFLIVADARYVTSDDTEP